MKRQGMSLLLLILAVVLVGAYGYFSKTDRITEVLDDNTVELAKGRRVHLVGVMPVADPIGIMPASGAGHTPDAPEGDEIEVIKVDSPFLDAIIEKAAGKKIVLEFPPHYSGDMASPDLFAYVQLEDGTDLGGWIIEQGMAHVDHDHDYDRKLHYLELERAARAAGRGVWMESPVEE